MKIHSKIPNQYFNTIKSAFPLLITCSLYLSSSVLFISCNSTGNQANVQQKAVESFKEYKADREQAVKQLSESSKTLRAEILKGLESNEVYQSLVIQKSIQQNYLPLLQAVGEGILGTTIDNNFSIRERTESAISQVAGGKKFVIDVIRLEIFGGLPDELLDVYERYVNEFGLSGFKGDSKYTQESQLKYKLDQDFTLTQTLAVIDNKNPKVLNGYYEAISSNLIDWINGSSDSYVFPYLTDKYSFNNYLKRNYPQSKYYIEYTLKTSAKNLYAEYDANEVSADEKYKDKRLAITGKIQDIGVDVSNDAYVTLATGGYGVVQCSFADKNVVKNLSKGKNITVVGNCSGKTLGNVILFDSVLF